MANNIQVRNALVRMGFSDEASTFVVENQGYTEAAMFARLDNTAASSVCKLVRKPGGANAQNADAPNLGLAVSILAESNFQLMCFYLHFKQRTSRPLVLNDVTVPSVERYINRIKMEENHKDPDPPTLTFKNWSRTFDMIDEYLSSCLGPTKIPLAYIVCETVEPLPHDQDPANGYPNMTCELVARAPHYVQPEPAEGPEHTPAYHDDNTLVFMKLSAMLRDKDCWSFMSKSVKTKDGRKAYLALKAHYLGKNNVGNLARAAEEQLLSVTYTGEGRRWNFEKYVKVHVDQHQVLEDLTRYGYMGIDPGTKVRFLLRGIKTMEVEHIRAQIMSSDTLVKDFDSCVNILQDYIRQKEAGKSAPRHSNVSQIDTRKSKSGSGGGDWDSVEPDMSIEDWFYKVNEYQKLTKAQQKGLRIKREKRRGKEVNSKGKDKTPHKAKKSFKKRVVAAVKSYLKSDSKSSNKKVQFESSDDDSSEEEDAKKGGSNRSNKALTLKRKQT